jgi:two-component system sensor histidine kinase AlgZ
LFGEFLDMAVRVEFPLILSVAALFLLQPLLPPALRAVAVVMLLVAGVVLPAAACWRRSRWRGAAAAGVVAGGGGVLAYFHLRGAAQAPVLAEARLLALTARIRPHFLFNSLNGVLGVLRRNPRRAEEALEELADLFRALMQDNRELVPLADEIALCERYLSLERLRLGERLQVAWQRDRGGRGAGAALLLQPLVENAVFTASSRARAGHGFDYHRAARAVVIIEIANPLLDPTASSGQPHGPRQHPRATDAVLRPRSHPRHRAGCRRLPRAHPPALPECHERAGRPRFRPAVGADRR